MEQLEILENYCKRFNEFNIFKVLKMQSGSENRHSNLIAWLLDPKGNHGLNTLFLDKFFTKLEIKLNEDSEYCQILREENCEIGRPDILIKDKNGNVVCVIEVKFGAKETNNQCKRYFDKYGTNCQYIFLDIDDKCYNELAVKEEYCHNDFNFSQIYKLATFKENILSILNDLIDEVKEQNIKSIFKQYMILLEEKYELYYTDSDSNSIFDIVLKLQKSGKEKEINSIFQKNNYDKTLDADYLSRRQYKIMELLYDLVKDRKDIQIIRSYNNSLSFSFKYKNDIIELSNLRTKNNSEIKILTNGKEEILFGETEYNETLFYVYGENTEEKIKNKLNEKLSSIFQ